MGSLGPLRSSLSQYRKRKRLTLDGTVGGIKPNRFRPGIGGAYSRRQGMQTRGAAPQGYMSSHPDAYEPHPGEAHFSNGEYTPYQADDLHNAPDALDPPTAFLDSGAGHTNTNRRQLFRAFSRWLQMQPELEVFPEPEREVIPFDHDPMLPRVEGPETHGFGPLRSTEAFIKDMVDELDEMVEQRDAKQVYDNLPLVYELAGRALRDSDTITGGTGAAPGYLGVDDGSCYEDDLSIPPDRIPEQDDGFLCDPISGAPVEADSEAFLRDDLGLGAEIAAKLGLDEHAESSAGAPDQLEYEELLSDHTTLEQIVDELTPSTPEPDPMLDEQLYDDDDLLMNPWMMPGMGPMPPGL